MATLYLTPGPSQLYPTVAAHMQAALETQVPATSHRSKRFMEIYAGLAADLKRLFQAPDDYQVFCFASATEIWERLAQNAIRSNSYHLVNGDFSSRFYEIAKAYGKNALAHTIPLGRGFQLDDIEVPDETELIACVANETSSGVWTSPEFIHALAGQHPEKLVVVDAVSCAPMHRVDLSKVDGLYFSVQKGFGLPAGLGVLLCGPRLLAKGLELATEGLPVGSYHSFGSLLTYAQKNQTPETPNVLAIYLLRCVVADFLRDIDQLRAASKAKADLLYAFLDAHPRWKAFVPEPGFRSETVIVVDAGEAAPAAIQALAEAGIVVGEGYGKLKSAQFRVANFPASSLSDFERLLQVLSALPA
jgi:phosphoserine aminotransferase